MAFEIDYYPNLKRPPRMRVNMVIGAPGSGKSTYVEKSKRMGDIILDLDAIRSEISGKPLHSFHSRAVTEEAIKVRNKRIEDIQEKAMPGNALWLIVGAGYTGDRLVWKRILAPYRTFVMNCSLETCIVRIKARNSETEYEQIEAAKKWFKTFEFMANETLINTEAKG